MQATIQQRRPRLRRGRLPRQLFPKHLERDYLAKLLDLLRLTHARVLARLVPQLPALVREQSAIRGDAPAGEVDDTLAAVRLELGGTFSSSNLERIVQPLGVGISRAQKDQLGRQVRAALGVEVPINDPNLSKQLESFTQENVALIKTIPRQYLEQVQSTVLAGITGGDRWEEIAADLEDRFNVAESRAALIARDQVGKFYGALQRARQENLGVTSYIWRTAGDERVREEHALREGERFQWDSPPEDGHPGEPINCRCTADPDLEAVLEQLDQ